MNNITPPQISEERIAQLWDAMPKAWPFPSEAKANSAAFAKAVAAEINRQWLERLEPVTTGRAGTVLIDGAIVCCNEHDREPCPSQPERRCKDCPGNATLYRIKEQG